MESTNYSVKAVVSIADLPEVADEMLSKLFSQRLRGNLRENPFMRFRECTLTTDNSNDPEHIIIKMTISEIDTSGNKEISERRIRRLSIGTINKFCEVDLESVAFKIDFLDINQ